LERRLSADIARMASAYTFSQSRWNNQKHGEKTILFQVKEAIDWKEAVAETDEVQNFIHSNIYIKSSNWKTCLYQEHSCFLTRLTEQSAKYSEDILEGAKVNKLLFFF
jgi:hypothetical protein